MPFGQVKSETLQSKLLWILARIVQKLSGQVQSHSLLSSFAYSNSESCHAPALKVQDSINVPH